MAAIILQSKNTRIMPIDKNSAHIRKFKERNIGLVCCVYFENVAILTIFL